MAKGIKTGGRTKGTPNKLTASVKEAITEALARAGGVEYLLRIANEDPRAFCTLLGKVVPMQVGGDPENPLNVVSRIELVPLTDGKRTG